MPFKKHVPKEHYKYNDYDEVKSWENDIWKDRLDDINPDIIVRICNEGLEEYRKLDPEGFKQRNEYGRENNSKIK